MTARSHPWSQAMRALAAVAVDQNGLKGVRLRARIGPLRQQFEDLLTHLDERLDRIHPDLSDTQLFGGLDVSASLKEQKLVHQPGLADIPSTLVLPMAERTTAGLAARLSQILDTDRGHGLILLDEGSDPEEHAPNSLQERLAFNIDLTGLRFSDTPDTIPEPEVLAKARDRLDRVVIESEHAVQLTAIAAQFGIDSLRAPLFALRAARAFAALEDRNKPIEQDLIEAAELVYAPRAKFLPDTTEKEPEPDSDQPQNVKEESGESRTGDGILEDMIIAAITARLPKDVLDQATSKTASRESFRGSGAGVKRRGNRRGRPLPSRAGRMDGHSRIDIIATLRCAAPFQSLRRAKRTETRKIILFPSDIRLRRFEEKSDRLLIFTVDASGSAAMARMAEAKGAVELMLAQAYAKRDQVALIAFRNSEADVLLPPTRSLVQAKRRLASLPGGGGTPLAAGLLATIEMADLGKIHGLAPSLIMLTDGRANVDLEGNGGRDRAKADVAATSAQLCRLGLPSVVIDTASRPGKEGKELAQGLGSHYLALPRADAERISAAADAALGT